MKKTNPYSNYGCDTREEYLVDLASEYGVPADIVFTLADVLGENEDFDGLVSELEDIYGF